MNKVFSRVVLSAGLCALLLPVALMAADMGKVPMDAGKMPMDMSRMPAAGMMPETEGMALMKQITMTDPYVKWDLMPGTSRMRVGKEPHGGLQNVYVNKPALKAFTDKAGALPDGGIIVKEVYSTENKLIAVNVMAKKKGYNPEAGDYLWLKYGPDMKILAQGKPAPCIACHTQAKDNDYVVLAPLKK